MATKTATKIVAVLLHFRFLLSQFLCLFSPHFSLFPAFSWHVFEPQNSPPNEATGICIYIYTQREAVRLKLSSLKLWWRLARGDLGTPPSVVSMARQSMSFEEVRAEAALDAQEVAVLLCRWLGDKNPGSETPVCFIILFVRIFRRVCSQFWLSVSNSVWGPFNRISRRNPSFCWLGGGSRGTKKLWTKSLWTNRRFPTGAFFGTTKETENPSWHHLDPRFEALSGLKWFKWPKSVLKWPKSGLKVAWSRPRKGPWIMPPKASDSNR